MALPVITDVYRVTFNWALAAALSPKNVWHLRVPSSNKSAIGSALATLLNGASYDKELWRAMADSYTLSSFEVLPLDGSSSSAIITAGIGSIAGGSATGDICPALAATVSFGTAQRGPRGRGRCYVGPIREAEQASGILLSTTLTTMQTAWTALLAALVAATPSMHLCVASYVHEDSNDVTSARVNTLLGTQRRRQDQLRS